MFVYKMKVEGVNNAMYKWTAAYWTCCVCVVLCCSNYWPQEPIGHAVCVLFSVVQTIGHSSLLDMLCVYSVVTCTTEYTGM